ncbi:N-acetylglucosamine-6-phosphate deacetylase [Shewanella eurypsychrophilus]|uniref:N-acetylgalactosamine-6-phosphate deacetylase n=1 Tax=Shewanella eurypsychrophilus TaxID=2593656 RepID=A0ABX6V416_9GAMM|nr:MULTISPECIES: N-acetylglucosamine-6-phosphate deacetylase [Shewanella]QFU22100.1 N-acetylglucosamine-6-phosphate deacetylase [Shewanella sp. YLB-09]QPG57388.1 N-acetylglucosamine-6-phosphate deacetylase [Shewanella eurypsychrophilus]
MITTLIAEQVFDGKNIINNQAISFEYGKVIALGTVEGAQEIQVAGLLTPGFIDIQVNGGGGYLFNHDTSLLALKAMVLAHSRFGSTGLLPTLITSDLDTINDAANAVSLAIKQKLPGIIGVHFEGPHISEPKKGIHRSEHIRALSERELAIYCRDDLGIKIVTLAPENVTTEQIKYLTDHNVRVCLGHSNANFEITQAAIDAGAEGFTHLFNAMSGLTSREPNMVGAALLDERTWCGMILDGHHVHPATAKLATSAKLNGKMMLVTDSMSTIGSDQQEFEFDGHQIQRSGDKLTSQTGQLAGSALDMITAVNNAQLMLDVTLEEALRMASTYPADFLGLNRHTPQLAIGTNADFTILQYDNNSALHVSQTWIDGKQIF